MTFSNADISKAICFSHKISYGYFILFSLFFAVFFFFAAALRAHNVVTMF